MRFSVTKEDQNEYRCCLCFHVRSGTILLGMWHMVMQMTVLTMFAVMALHPEYLKESPNVSQTVKVYMNSFDNTDDTMDNVNWFQKKQWNSDDRSVGVLISVCTLVLTLMLIYGALKGRPGYLMPFFCLQVFDFCITCLSVVAYFSYMPNVKDWIKQQDNLPMRDEFLKCGEWLMLLVILIFVLVMTFKAYFIGVVWACYKYLCRRALEPSVTLDTEGSDSEMLLPPKYEDAIKFSAQQPMHVDLPPPPPYSSQSEPTVN